jgi:hypothetical protein
VAGNKKRGLTARRRGNLIGESEVASLSLEGEYLMPGFKGNAIIDFWVVKRYKLLVFSLNILTFLINH